jgi:signal transduction histidine kinase/CheY-like chemotaxis protein
MKTSILYIFLLSVLYACDSHSLLPPKQQLDQQIAQLNDYSLLSGPLNDQLCEEIETHAQEIGNDSLLLATRQIIYTRYCRLQDTAHARMLLDRMKPYAIRIKDKHLLMNHLRMAFLHAQTRQPAECERWINEARKYAYINPQNWYITAASACLECGLYPQALIYADSALVNLKYKVISSPHLVKAIALSRTGKTAEAEEWTQRCITDIRHFQAKHQIHTISYLQYQLFMEYAVSLRKHGKNKEALSVLEELDRVSFNNVATPLLRNKDNIEEYKVRVARMLSECHYATGNQSEAIQQANRADSLQSHYAQEQMNIRRKMISESLQNELKRRAQILSITLGAMNAFTWFFEPDKNRISFGEGFNEVTKKASEICSVEKFLSCVHPDDKQKFHDSLQAVVEQDNGIWELEYQLDLNGDGVYQWWQTRGMLETSTLNDAPYKYMFGMTICIDVHKQAELTLLKNKEELKKLVTLNELVLNNTNSGLAYITRDYRVQWENVSSCSKSLSFEAYKQGELCYKSAHNRTSPCEECILSRAFQSRQTELIKFKLDNAHVVEVYGTPVFLEDGTADGIVIRVDDVTEREEMIKELQIAKMHAEQSDKLKSAFLANMSHEIRTPLNAIVGFSGLMMYASDEEKEDYMQIINNNNEMLLKLISDILDLSKLEAGSVELNYEEFDLTDYFNSMFVSMKQRATNPKIQIVAVNPYQHCLVTLDRNRVAQIITNYVTNAIKYTPEGIIEMGYEYREEGIYFYVKDSGIGIPDEKKNKVFHRFEKLDEFAQGTGLGLSICKAIAEAMGGNVGFESEYGKGSLFWALLPCEVEIPSEITLQRAERVASSDKKDIVAGTSSSNTPGRKTILVAEDIQSNYQLVSALLRKRFNLVHAANGQEAIEILHKRHIDLLLMDMKMPVMDGLTATAEIRKFNAELPIIALTAHVFENDRLTAMDAGCNEYLVKPIDRAKLMAVLKKYS